MKLATPQLPLFDFFQTLCAWEKQLNQQTLTLVEYELLAKVLDNCPFPLESKEDYYRLCKLLWFKPFHAVADDLNTEGGLFRQKFETFWTDLETFNNTPTNVQAESEKPVETSPENKPIDNSRTLTEEQIREREEQQRKLAEQKRNQGITLSDNDNELSPYWADFSPAKPVNTEGGNIGNMSNAPTNDKRGLAIKQDFTFLEKHQFMPLDYRRLYQLVMSVRRVSFDGGRSGFDFEGSFKRLIQQGYLTEFVYQQRSRRWLNVHLLIEPKGSTHSTSEATPRSAFLTSPRPCPSTDSSSSPLFHQNIATD